MNYSITLYNPTNVHSKYEKRRENYGRKQIDESVVLTYIKEKIESHQSIKEKKSDIGNAILLNLEETIIKEKASTFFVSLIERKSRFYSFIFVPDKLKLM